MLYFRSLVVVCSDVTKYYTPVISPRGGNPKNVLIYTNYDYLTTSRTKILVISPRSYK